MINQKILNDPSTLNLRKSIIATLVWFNMRGRALTIGELEKLLYQNIASQYKILEEIKKIKLIVQRNNYFYLKKYQKIIQLNRPKKWYKNKWKIAYKTAKILSFIPYIRLVGVVNSVADGTAKKESDIDLFIVAKNNRLFITRFFVTGMLQLANLRRYRKKIKDLVCLSFYATENSMNLEKIAIDKNDIYLKYFVAELKPILATDRFYDKFVGANVWAQKFIPNFLKQQKISKPNIIARNSEKLFDSKFGDWLEKICEKHQLCRIANHPKHRNLPNLPNFNPSIIANQNMLKFHEIDRRRFYREMWEEGIKKTS